MADPHYHAEVARLLARASSSPRSMPEREEDAIALAAVLLEWANSIETADERNQQDKLAGMMADPKGKAFTTSMTDQCFRSSNSVRVADQLVFLIKKFGIPKFLSCPQRIALWLFRCFGKLAPGWLIPIVRKILRQETRRVILPGEPDALIEHMQRRRAEGVRINLNHLGEAVFGDAEARHRLQTYLEDLNKPEVEYISVKISTIFSQINLLSADDTVSRLSERLRRLYRAARDSVFMRADDTQSAKFVNLDMEEYGDLRLTTALFCRVLDEEEFKDLSAGIVLQAYVPDSYLLQKEITEWALKRQENGGAPIKIRLVKGANLAMEQVAGALHGWPQAPYTDKTDVDANFKRMVLYGMQNAKAVHLGIGSHNLFDIAFALLLKAENGLQNEITFEMLEGMADHLRRVVQEVSGNMLLYCPAAKESEFQNAIAYLIRRLDENTAPSNFLRHAFGLVPNSKEWNQQVALFREGCQKIESVSQDPRRSQNRQLPSQAPEIDAPFQNEPDTDWSQPSNRQWIENIIREWSQKPKIETPQSSVQDIDAVLNAAQNASWPQLSHQERNKILANVAQILRQRRADLMGVMMFYASKTAAEADIEIQEAIDFIEYYRREVEKLFDLEDVTWRPKGIVVVASPWNFPCSIPIGGIVAALTAGNTVLFKPAPEAVEVGYVVAKAFWEAGVPQDALHFIACNDEPEGSFLIRDSRVATVILTGATVTAKHLLRLRPGLDLLAETGGKNAIIVTSMADRDLAIKDIVQSAFGHAGQKCSACSLLICEAEVYDNRAFRRQLSDAVSSLITGQSWDLRTRISPLIRPASGALLKGLTHLEPGEQWLLCPQQDPNDPELWSPGIKLGVKPGSFTHQTELFGPVLGVMRASNLDDAIAIANATRYGLTSGLQSLDEREQHRWIEHIQAGNLYINRGITGAVVRRQPFGGFKESSFGPGNKAGGPNYLVNLMVATQNGLPKKFASVTEPVLDFSLWVESRLSLEQLEVWKASLGNYCYYWQSVFAKAVDVSRVLGQDNLFIYRHINTVMRVEATDAPIDVWRVCAAALICGSHLELSGTTETLETVCGYPGLLAVVENQEAFVRRVSGHPETRVRLLHQPSDYLNTTLARYGVEPVFAPVLANGRLELLHYLREISLSIDYHRYGNLGEREGDLTCNN